MTTRGRIAAVAAVTLLSAAGGAAAAPAPHLKSGQRIVFPAGALRVGSKVFCASHGIHMVARVPKRGRAVAKIAHGSQSSATLDVRTLADGRVIANCR